MKTRQTATMFADDEFREVLALDTDSQRALLRGDDPRYRVWAAWALGLELADDFADTVRDLVADEPNPGVRRHLLVMLVGYGEVDIVAALARHDPDPYVRATATRYVAELSADHPELHQVLSECLTDGSAHVRGAVVSCLPDDAPPRLWSVVESAAGDADTESRRATVRRLLQLDRTPNVLRDRALTEPVTSIRRSIVATLARRGEAESLFETAREKGLLPRLLDDIHASGQTFDWRVLRRVEAGRSLLRVLDIDSLDAEGRQWLLGLDDSHRLPTLTYVQRAYRNVGSLATSDEREAVTEYVERLSPHLESEEAAGDREGELVEWGTLFETEPIEFRTLSKLRDLLEEH